jgi:hypothetical protein
MRVFHTKTHISAMQELPYNLHIEVLIFPITISRIYSLLKVE